MNDLFRFLVIRKPATPAPGSAIPLSTDTPLSNQLDKARSADLPLPALRKVADAYLRSDQSVHTSASLPSGPALVSVAAAAAGHASTHEQLQSEVRTAFGADAGAVAGSKAFETDERRLSDTLLALPLASEAVATAVASSELVDMYRAAALVRDLAQGVVATRTPAGDMRRPIVLPAQLFPLPTPADHGTVVPAPAPTTAEYEQHVARAREAGEVARALAVLADLPAAEPLSSSAGGGVRAAGEPAQGDAAARPTSDAAARPTSDAAGGPTIEAALVGDRGVARGLADPAPPLPSLLEQVPAETRRTITSLGSGVGTLPVASIQSALLSHYNELVGQTDPGIIALINGWDATSEPAAHDDAGDPAPAVLNEPPKDHGAVQPAGIADLLVVRRHVLRYEPGEVAYVENVAAGEDLQRVTRRSTSTQTTVTVDVGTSNSEERDTQATSRFDLNRQSQSVLQSDFGRVPGAPQSESYGALVQTGGSKQDASSSATNFSQDITSRAASTIAQEFHTQTVTSTLAGFEEDVTHHFDNSRGTAPEHVVYQWLDKIDQAQVFTYGQRTMYDITVPEPGAFLLRSLTQQQPDLLTLRKPAPFTIEPSQLDELNYLYYAAGYGATGVQAPPERYSTVAQPWTMDPTGNPINTTRSLPITIPAGYSATRATVVVVYLTWGSPGFFVTVGQRRLDFGGPGESTWQSTALNQETGSIPVTVIVDGDVFDCAINLEILCTRTQQSYVDWQLRTHDTILQASRDRMTEYETRWATLRAALRLLSFGQSTARKRQLERGELQKAALAVLTTLQLDGLSAIEHSAQGYPQPFLSNVEPLGRYVRFLEQSFEWDQMMYLFYPYFWGRKPYWIDRVLLEDADDQFGDFLRAGFARVIVPVRPGFEGVVASFMSGGGVPSTGDLGQLTSATYLPYLAEALDASGGPDTATPYGPPWEVRLPTTLTTARRDATLPRWKEQTDAQGHSTWVSDGDDPVG